MTSVPKAKPAGLSPSLPTDQAPNPAVDVYLPGERTPKEWRDWEDEFIEQERESWDKYVARGEALTAKERSVAKKEDRAWGSGLRQETQESEHRPLEFPKERDGILKRIRTIIRSVFARTPKS